MAENWKALMVRVIKEKLVLTINYSVNASKIANTKVKSSSAF